MFESLMIIDIFPDFLNGDHLNMAQKEFLVRHQCGVVISRELKEFAMAEIGNIEKRDIGNGYVWYSLPKAEVLGKNVLFSLCFFKGNLSRVDFSLSDPMLYGSSWDDWSEEKERLCASHTRQWLSDNGYYLGLYSWGEIWANYDPKGGSGGGGVIYNPYSNACTEVHPTILVEFNLNCRKKGTGTTCLRQNVASPPFSKFF